MWLIVGRERIGIQSREGEETVISDRTWRNWQGDGELAVGGTRLPLSLINTSRIRGTIGQFKSNHCHTALSANPHQPRAAPPSRRPPRLPRLYRELVTCGYRPEKASMVGDSPKQSSNMSTGLCATEHVLRLVEVLILIPMQSWAAIGF